MSVHGPILRQCLRHPFRVAVVDDRRSYRGIDILIASLHVASLLRARCRTDTVGLLLPTGGAFPIAALGAWMLGKVVVPLNYLLKPDELQYVIDDCGTDTVLTVQPLLDFIGAPPRVPNLLRLEDVNFKSLPRPRVPARKQDSDLAVLLYTSGTSGKPKGVMLTHGNLSVNIRQVAQWVTIGPSDRIAGVLPQFHSFGLTVLTLMPLTLGCMAVYTARFVPQKIVRMFRDHRPTMFVAIPSMYGALLAVKEAGPEDFTSFRFIVSGGEPLPDAIAARFHERFGVRLNEGYGLTETSPVTNWCRPEEYRPHSVGRALPEIEERIVEPETERDVPPGTDGEVWIKGPNVMRGYYKLPDETARVLRPDGFFRTGDMGRMDADGHLYITGRIKEMMIIGGENVFPREIEEVLNRHPSVQASGVIGVRDDVRGELPWAFVEVREGATFDERALRSWCRERLAGYKVPTEIRRVDALPRNPTGKILRRELRAMAESAA